MAKRQSFRKQIRLNPDNATDAQILAALDMLSKRSDCYYEEASLIRQLILRGINSDPTLSDSLLAGVVLQTGKRAEGRKIKAGSLKSLVKPAPHPGANTHVENIPKRPEETPSSEEPIVAQPEVIEHTGSVQNEIQVVAEPKVAPPVKTASQELIETATLMVSETGQVMEDVKQLTQNRTPGIDDSYRIPNPKIAKLKDFSALE